MIKKLSVIGAEETHSKKHNYSFKTYSAREFLNLDEQQAQAMAEAMTRLSKLQAEAQFMESVYQQTLEKLGHDSVEIVKEKTGVDPLSVGELD